MINNKDLQDIKTWLNTNNDPVFIREEEGVEHFTLTLTGGEAWNIYHTVESGYVRASKH